MEEEQLYLEADKYLTALSEHKSQAEAEKVFSSFVMKESVQGILIKEGLIVHMVSSNTDCISQLGKAEINKGGLYKRYLKEKRQEQAVLESAKWSKIAAIASVSSIIIAIISIAIK
jgi:hypothetical protein